MRSWGGLPEQAQQSLSLDWRDQALQQLQQTGLVVGLGRSYGDVGLAANGRPLLASGLNRVLSFDAEQGLLRCESGVTLGAILQLCMPAGWMLPVVPGTRFVTVGGAIANDVHGKNHHAVGCFGKHLRSVRLLRSDGQEINCSAEENPDWFAATVSGLGLTGCILEAELQLRPLAGGYLDTESIKFQGLSEFLELSAESASRYEYSAAWIDCLSRDVRGLFSRANHSPRPGARPLAGALCSVPVALPFSPLNRVSLRLFNSAWYHRQRADRRSSSAAYDRWMFPLDRIENWNRLYGKRGFRQYQCVVPAESVAELLALIRASGQGSLLAVLKQFGSLESPGLLSFPRPGITLALDFPWRGETTLKLFAQLDQLVAAADGAIYPAKDAHMSAADFRRAYPRWETLEKFRDPALCSLFWQRLTQEDG